MTGDFMGVTGVCAIALTMVDGWCRRGESNPRPRDYETLALPLSYAGTNCPRKARQQLNGPYFFFAASAYFFWKRSTRPAVSISFCLPVKNGWQLEQISTRSNSPLCVERV